MPEPEPSLRRRGARIGAADALAGLGAAVVLVGLLTVLPVVPDASSDGPAPLAALASGWWLAGVLLLIQSLLLVGVRLRPRAVLVAVAVAAATTGVVVPDAVHGLADLAVAAAVAVAVLRSPTLRMRSRASVAALAAATVLVAVGDAVAATILGVDAAVTVPAALLQAAAVVGIPLLVALVVRSRREVRTAQRSEAAAGARERDAQIAAAVATERAAMARELHDIAAHHLSGVTLMLGVVDRQIDADPSAAHTGVRQAREQSRAVLDDLRRLVGLLRDEGAAPLAVESLAGIEGLVGRARTGGPIDLRLLSATGGPGAGESGIGAGVGPLAQLAAYRTVQEALTNAAVHAPGAVCEVVVDDRDADAVTVQVENGPAPSASPPGSRRPGGHGLRGMRERAELVGALLEHGPTDAGGWRVRLVVRREPDARAGVIDTARGADAVSDAGDEGIRR